MTVHTLVRTALLFFLALAPSPAAAQESVTVSGTVRDGTGGVIPDATIEVRVGGESVASDTTDAEGRFRLLLRRGVPSSLIAARDGFETETVALAAATTAIERNLTLRVAAFGDAVVVTASGTAERRTTVNESVTVIASEQIRAMGANSLGDAISAVPALNVESTGREGSLASLFTRGGESDYNLVMIDGVRVNITGGRFNFNRVSAGEIERVEVVRGAQSSLYGSAAIGAVVHVVTKRAAPSDPPQVSGAFELGNFNTRRGEMMLFGGAMRRFDYKVAATYRESDGAFQDLLPERDRYRQTAADVGAGAVLGRGATLRLTGRYSDADGRSVGPIVYGSRDTGTRFDSRDRSLSVQYRQQISGVFEQSASVAYFDSESDSFDTVVDPRFFVYAVLKGQPGALFPNSPRLVRLIDKAAFDALAASGPLPAGEFLASTPTGVADSVTGSRTPFRRPAFNYRADVNWGEGQLLSGGYEYERESEPTAAAWIIENHAYFLQQQFRLDKRWFITVGARVDDNSRFGAEISPKVSVGGFLRPYTGGPLSSVRAYANFGRGIKNPVFSELFGSAFVDGNPGLHPERARTVDAGVEATFADQYLLARATYFDNSFLDQVAFLASGPTLLDGVADYVNIDGSKANGWELELGLQRPVAGLTATAGYAFVDTEVTTSVNTSDQFQPGQPLLRRPKHSVTAQAQFLKGPLGLALTARRIGERHDSAFLPLRTLPEAGFPTGRATNITVNPAYTWLGISGEYRLHRGTAVYLKVNNLTDAAYESALGYPGLPRAAVAGVRIDLGARK